MMGWCVLLGISGGVMVYYAMVLFHVAAASILTGDVFVWLGWVDEPLVVAHVVIMPIMFMVAYRSIKRADGFGRRNWAVILGVGISCFVGLSAWSLLTSWLYGS